VALFLDARASSEIAPLVADIMAEEFGYDENWKKEQVNEYNKLVINYL
jgi:glycerol-3-phosphate dehydrogenase